MTEKIKPYSLILGLLAAGLLYYFLSSLEKPSPVKIKAASLEAYPTKADRNIVISAHPGEPLVLNFFASWCKVCDQEAQHLPKIARLVENAGGKMLGIITFDTATDFKQSGKELGKPYQLALDESGSYASSLGVEGIPHTFLVDRQGKVIYQVRGPMNQNDVEVLTNHLEKMGAE